MKLICLIIEELGWTARPNQIHQFHQLSLWEWESWLRIDWIWRAAGPLCGLWMEWNDIQWSKGEWMNEMKRQLMKLIGLNGVNERSCEWWNWCWAASFGGGYGRLAAMGSAKERERSQTTSIDSWNNKGRSNKPTPTPPSIKQMSLLCLMRESWELSWLWSAGNCAAIVGRPATINSSFLHQSIQLNQKSLVCWGLNEKKRLNLIDCPAHTLFLSFNSIFPFIPITEKKVEERKKEKRFSIFSLL